MEKALTLTKSQHADSLAVATRQARKFISQAKAPSTVRAYRSDWRHFEDWCAERKLGRVNTNSAKLLY